MRTSAIDTTAHWLRRAALAIALTGSLVACSDSTGASATESSTSAGPGSTGVGGGGAVGTSSGAGGAAASTTESAGGSGATTSSNAGGSGTTSSTTGTGGGATTSTSSGGPGGAGGATNAPPVVACTPIAAGMSTVSLNNLPRLFSVQMPADTSHMALLFLWHGWMQNPLEFASTIVYDVPAGQWVPFDPNAFPMPLMIVTPFDNKLVPPFGLDWDIVGGGQDFEFFEAMLQCIQQQFDIDTSRIYSLGFSAGAVFTDLLSAKYPNRFAATISESGAWFNDKNEWSDVSVPIMQWKWPAFDAADRGNVLLTHGGPNDFASVISLESANQKALPFLHGAGRTVTECGHTFGHTLDPDLTQDMYYQWMWAHQLGGPAIGGLPPGFPTPWAPVGATSCTFHPSF